LYDSESVSEVTVFVEFNCPLSGQFMRMPLWLDDLVINTQRPPYRRFKDASFRTHQQAVRGVGQIKTWTLVGTFVVRPTCVYPGMKLIMPSYFTFVERIRRAVGQGDRSIPL
jgi:hypothetical protein